MKRLGLILLLAVSAVRANDLADSWRSFGHNSRVASGAKAVVVGVFALEALRESKDQLVVMSDVIQDGRDWKVKYQPFIRAVVACASTGYAGFNLGYYFLPEHLKHALAMS